MKAQSQPADSDVLSAVAHALLQNVVVLGRAAELSNTAQRRDALQKAKQDRAKLLHDLSALMWRHGVAAIDQTAGLNSEILEKFQSDKNALDTTVAEAALADESGLHDAFERALSYDALSPHLHNFLRTLASRSEHARGNLTLALSARVAQAGATVSESVPPDGGVAPLNVLLVEDNASVAAVTEEMLIELGWRVTREVDAGAALLALSEGGIDLVLSDIMMPGNMDGLELAKRARELFPRMPIVLSSGYVERIRQKAKEAGIPLLAKPYRLQDLASAIEAARPIHAS